MRIEMILSLMARMLLRVGMDAEKAFLKLAVLW